MLRRGIAIALPCLVIACGDASSPEDGVDTEGSSTTHGGPASTSTSPPSTGGTTTNASTSGDDGSEGGDGSSTGGDPPPPASTMPAGIPFPTFGYDVDTSLPPTLWVDNTHPDCDDTQGTQAAPRCDLFAGTDTAELDAGTVVSVAGGPYTLSEDKVLRFQGTPDAPVIIRGEGDTPRFQSADGRVRIRYEGTYAVVDNLEFLDRTQHQIPEETHHFTLRAVEIHNSEGVFIDFNPVVNIAGQDILIHDSRIYDNRRENDSDSHGVQAWQGAANVWLLDNELFNNNGDSFQGCHECFENPPHHVYIGRNEMHEDRENGVDLKTIHDVVVSENVLWGYGGSNTSAGDAMVIGSNGFDDSTNQGPRNVWVLGNEFRDSPTGVRVEGVEDAWLVGNVFRGLTQGLQIDNKEYRDVVIAGNTFHEMEGGIYSYNSSCSADTVTMAGNIFSSLTGRHIDVPDCPGWTLSNNLFSEVSIRFGGANETSVDAINGLDAAMGNLEGDPQYEDGLVPAATSPAVDMGADLGPYLEAVEAAYGGDAHFDRNHAPRPAGDGYDIGAYER